MCVIAESKRFAWTFVNEVRQELRRDRDFHTKVTYIQEGYKEERFHDETAEELGWIAKSCVVLILWPHMLRCLYPGIHRLWVLESLIRMLEWLINASLVFTRTILLRFTEPIL